MLQPSRRKHRKEFRGTMTGVATRGSQIAFGEFGLKAMECGWVSAAQLESARRTITHHTKRGGKLWLRIFPHKPLTHKAAGSKMGSGKGAIDHYEAVVKPGMIMFEIAGVTEEMAKTAFSKAGHKLSVKTTFVKKA